MSDFNVIRYRGGMLTAEATREFHSASRQWLAAPFNGRTVVVTHDLPHKLSNDRQFHRNPLNPAFASHLPELERPPVNLWIHGLRIAHASTRSTVLGCSAIHGATTQMK
jgi:hypothetical protein